MNSDERCNMAIEVLQKTHDGDNLAPCDLWLLQEWVNDHLNEKGEALFRDIHAKVTAGTYKAPWFHGIENLTLNHQGYVFWKGVEVEHYSFASNYGPEAQAAAEEVGRRCLILESKGIQPTCKAVVWDWDKSQEE